MRGDGGRVPLKEERPAALRCWMLPVAVKFIG